MQRHPHPPNRPRPAAGSRRPNRAPHTQRRGYRPPMRWPLARAGRRLRVVLVALAIVLSLCGGRLLQLQGFDTEAYATQAQQRLTTKLKLYPIRGTITDRNGTVLAASQPGVTITADPTLTTPHAAQIADILAAHLGVQHRDAYVAALTKPNTRFAYVARKVPAATFDAIAADLQRDNLVGIFRESDPMRDYPGGTLAAPLLGAVGADGTGLTGFEYAMNSQLSGTPGEEVYESSPNGSKIPLGTNVTKPAKNGVSYQLTIDAELQYMTQRRLAARQAQVGAKDGIAVTMDIKSGAVLAMASTPGYNANDIAAANPRNIPERAVTQTYEPGSVEKVLTFAAMIDAGYATANTKVVVPPSVASGDGRIHDDVPHGTEHLTARGVLAQSSNIGTVLLTRQMPKTVLHNYLQSFGLGAPTGIGLPGEAAGYLPPATMKDYTRDQIAFGQGLSVTAIQEAAAIAGILNGGVYNAPTIIKSATDADGRRIDLHRPEPRRVIKESTSKTVANMMESVVGPGGTAPTLGIKGYRVAGKTGTAQRVDPACGCYRGYTTSFVEAAPADNPQILTYVVFDAPQNTLTGSGSAGPVVHDLMEFALSRFGVWPSSTEGPKGGLTW